MPGLPVTPDWTPRFLHELARHGNLTLAARTAGVDRAKVWALRFGNAAFNEACLHAHDAAADRLELELRDRRREA